MVLGDTLGIDAAPQFITERVTVVSNGSASTYYATWTKNLHKDGYWPISCNVSFNQVIYHAYALQLDGETVTVGVAKSSGSIGSLTVWAEVVYMKI